FNFEIVAWASLLPFLWAIREKAPYQAAILGFVTGFVFFNGLIYWIYVVLTEFGHLPGPVAIVFLIILNAYLALYFAAFGYLFRWISGKFPLSEFFFAPVLWVSLEYLRGPLLSGFPWEMLGYSQFLTLPMIQIADLAGVYGVSFVIVLANMALYKLAEALVAGGLKPAWKPIALAGVMIAATNLYGQWRLGEIAENQNQGKSFQVLLVQGNIRQDVKWEPSFQKETVSIYSALTRSGKSTAPDLIIWPETATPFFFQEPSHLQSKVLELPDELEAPLLLGAPAYSPVGTRFRYFNSAFLLAPKKGIAGRYDKVHLVPFGEYAPFADVLDFTRDIIGAIGDFTPGKRAHTLSLPDATFGVLICYEAIFPDLTRQFVDQGAQFLVNITNDAWFGRTAAPYQHFSMVSLRAVENRVFIARAANTGISGVIDPSGRITLASPLFTRGAFSGKIYLMNRSKTFYTHYGDIFAYACLGITLLSLLFRGKRG
ncbi:MAG: apolipoprotein N-acyltransferase, partial [Deltaproteobacteria bacterium]|nr:apolipoprotein N-acyltransferase [Deltaproteobacteria bacterium]